MRSKQVLFVVVAGVLLLSGGLIWQQQLSENTLSVSPGDPMVVVFRPELLTDALEGEIAFQANCAKCHGGKAEGRNGIGPPLVHKIYEPGHHGDGAFYLAATRGVRAHHWTFGNMPPVDTVTEQEVGKIVAYIRALQRANGIH